MSEYFPSLGARVYAGAQAVPRAMANPDFKTYKASVYNPAVHSEFEGNVISTRLRGTRPRGEWRMSWSSMSDADKATLEAFFRANAGRAFVFVPFERWAASVRTGVPLASSDTRLAVFGDDRLDFVMVTHEPRWAVSVTLYETTDNPVLNQES